MIQTLKLQRKYWEDKTSHRKPWEIRTIKDRIFEVGEMVSFAQVTDDWDRTLTGVVYGPVRITYVLGHEDASIVPEGTCIFTHTQA